MLIIFFRTLILYAVVVIVMRCMGKRQIGELQPFELVVAILISELAAVPMQNTGIPLLSGIIPILTLLIAQITLSLVTLKNTSIRKIVCGSPSMLIENGKLKEDMMKKELYSINDLLEQLRNKDVPNIADVEFAILETNGQLSVIPKSQKRPVTPQDLHLPTNYEGLSLNLVIDGEIDKKNLKRINLGEDWLRGELSKLGISDIHQVLFASIDSEGKIYYQKKE